MMTLRCVNIIAVFLLCQQGCVESAVEECSGDAEYSILGMMLRRHIFKTIRGAPLGDVCLRECYRDSRCQSFNYVISHDMCELNNRTKEARPEDFVPNSDRYYFKRDMNRVRLGTVPDLPAESCKEIKASEGEYAVNGKYWFHFLEIEKILLAYCDMKTGDVDECSASESFCDVNADCKNTRGSYCCLCKPGFTGDGRTCSDVDECSANSHSCDVNAVCSNTHGSYTCTCKAGYSGDGRSCSDVDECSSNSHSCDVNAVCSNTHGSYTCACKAGYSGDGKSCTDVDECSASLPVCDVNANCKNTRGSYRCSCKAGFTGDGKTCTAANKGCAELYKSGIQNSGVYTINPDGLGTFDVLCDQTTAGGGWTVFQKRMDGSVDFYRGWADYKRGFGNFNGEFWLGLDKINHLTSSGKYKLRVDLEDFAGNTAYAEYDLFGVGSEGTKYLLTLGSYSGTAGDSLTYHNGYPFTTKDQDNDNYGNNCAVEWKGAWWYCGCHRSNLNGVYHHGQYRGGDGVRWYHWKLSSAKRAEMKIRPINY